MDGRWAGRRMFQIQPGRSRSGATGYEAGAYAVHWACLGRRSYAHSRGRSRRQGAAVGLVGAGRGAGLPLFRIEDLVLVQRLLQLNQFVLRRLYGAALEDRTGNFAPIDAGRSVYGPTFVGRCSNGFDHWWRWWRRGSGLTARARGQALLTPCDGTGQAETGNDQS